MSESETITKTKPKSKWLKRLGIGAFAFFFIKGIVWLVVFFFAAKSCMS